jgi:hypothetical protein
VRGPDALLDPANKTLTLRDVYAGLAVGQSQRERFLWSIDECSEKYPTEAIIARWTALFCILNKTG